MKECKQKAKRTLSSIWKWNVAEEFTRGMGERNEQKRETFMYLWPVLIESLTAFK